MALLARIPRSAQGTRPPKGRTSQNHPTIQHNRRQSLVPRIRRPLRRPANRSSKARLPAILAHAFIHLLQDPPLRRFRLVHRILLLQRWHLAARAPKSDVRHLHALHHLRPTSATNHASLRHPTLPIRS